MFMPENADSDRVVEAGGVGTFQPLIFEIDTFDEFARDGLLFMGRPLWKMNWQYRHNKKLHELVKFAAHKLYRTRAQSNEGLIALFLCRFGLNASGELAKRLVASHMATLIGVSVDRKELRTTYKSEPILAEASAYLTTYEGVKVQKVLYEIFAQLQEKVLKSAKGDRGEIAAAAWFGYTLDHLRKLSSGYTAESLSARVDVLTLIRQLCEPELTIEDKVIKLLEGWTVNVTHFCRLGYSPTRDALHIAWQRHVGFYMPEGEEGVDFVIAASTKEDTSLAAIRVQVKNLKNPIREASKNGFFQKLDVRRCAPVSTFLEEPVSIAFLVQVGTGKMLPGVELQALGRKTRNTPDSTPRTQQVQIACSISSRTNEKWLTGLRNIAGASLDLTEFTMSSDHFQRGELLESDEVVEGANVSSD